MNTHTNPKYRLAVLKDCKGDLSKSWYIEFYVFSEATNDLVRKRQRIPPSLKTVKSRKDYAKQEIAKINEVLINGFYLKTDPLPTPDREEGSRPELVKAFQDLLPALRAELRSDTIDSYASAINKLIAYNTPIQIDEVNSQYVYKFRDFILEAGGTAINANNLISHLRALFSRVMVREGIERNPFNIKFLQTPQSTNSNIAFTNEDRDLLEQYMIEHDFKLYLFTRFMYYAFIRPKELRMLTATSINLRDRLILIGGNVSKNRKTEQVSIIPPLQELIVNHLVTIPPNYYLFGKLLDPGLALASVNYAYDCHTKALKETGLLNKGYTLYSWKHTGAVNAYLSGVGIKQLQTLLRHSSVQITDIYLKSLGLRTDPNLGNYNW